MNKLLKTGISIPSLLLAEGFYNYTHKLIKAYILHLYNHNDPLYEYTKFNTFPHETVLKTIWVNIN